MCFDPYNPLGYENVENYFAQEWEYMADGEYCSNRYKKRMRQEALDVIIETIRKGDEKVKPFVPYLAMNYFDCYLSRNGGLLKKKDKMIEDNELLAICCLSLAYKTTLSVDTKTLNLNMFKKSRSLEEKIHQFLLKRSKNGKYIQGREVHDVEKVIENGLKGRMKSITPMCFIGYFLKACEPQDEALEVRQSITHIILETQSDIRFCSYKPSLIAASAVVVFLSNQDPEHSETYEEKIMRLRCLDKNCVELVKEACAKNAKRNLKADYELDSHMKKMTLHGTTDYELQWMTSAEIAELHAKYFDPYDPSGLESIDDYLKKEPEFMADGGYSENPNNKRLRQVALHTIRISGKVDPFVPYLAVTYVDYYISRNGSLAYRDTVLENMELLAISCIYHAFETTFTCDFWGEDEASKKIREYMSQRPKSRKYLYGSNGSFGDGCLINHIIPTSEKPVTALSFINYFLNECKPRCEAPKERQTITKIILELQSDIRLCAFKPSIISAAAVTAFKCHQAPEYCYEDKIMRLSCIDKNDFKTCLALVKKMYAKMKIGADTETEILSLQDDGKGFLVTIDYKPEWMTAPEIISLYDVYFDPYDPRGLEDIDIYLAMERRYMAHDGYSDNVYNERMRQIALNAIIETIRMGGKVDAFVPYLAMNYYDRYVSRRGIWDKMARMTENIELLAVHCLSLSFETTLSYGCSRENQYSDKIREYLLKRPRNVNYLQSLVSRGAEDMIKDWLILPEPITGLCFIGYVLKECEATEEKEQITRVILETQDDIRFSCYKPSIIAGSAVIAFFSDRSPEYSQIYEEKVERLLGYIDKNKLKNCLVLMKETYDKKNLRADIGMRKLSVQGGENGLHVSIDYQLQWKVSDEIEEILKTLGAGTRVSIQLAKVYKRMMGEAEEIAIFLSEIENAGDVDQYAIEDLTGMLENFGRLSKRMEEVIIKSTHYREDPQ
ncbi:unnamed protein product [Arabidopsis lyrata]|nr:unnamed protein product [Arabidopsis lyrata]